MGVTVIMCCDRLECDSVPIAIATLPLPSIGYFEYMLDIHNWQATEGKIYCPICAPVVIHEMMEGEKSG